MLKEEKVINALRMGVIPEGHLQSFMVGKDKEKVALKDFMEAIATGGSQVRFLRGAYGSGKSFMLKYVESIAKSQNYIVATIPMHSGFGFSKFEDIYSSIMANLSSRVDAGGSSFEEIFDHWLRQLRRKGDMNNATQNIFRVITELNRYNSSFANVLLVYIRAKINHDFDLANTAAAWIKGDKNMSYQLKRQLQVKGSVDRENAMDIFKGFVKLIHEMGYKGIIVTFDEAELMMHQRVDIRLKAYGNIRQLMDFSGGGELNNCGFIFAGTPELFDNIEKGIPSYQALHQRIGTLLGGQHQLDNLKQPLIQLQPFTKEDYMILCDKVVEIHERLRGYKLGVQPQYMVNLVMLESNHLVGAEGLTIRIFLKKLIELLDLLIDNPELPIFKAMRNR